MRWVAVICLPILIICGTQELSFGQAGQLEFEICEKAGVLRDVTTAENINRGIFACSKVASDETLPSEVRAAAFTARGWLWMCLPQIFPTRDFHSDYQKAILDFSDAIKMNPAAGRAFFLRAIARQRTHFSEPGPMIADLTAAFRLKIDRQGALPGITSDVLSTYRKQLIDHYREVLKRDPADLKSGAALKELEDAR